MVSTIIKNKLEKINTNINIRNNNLKFTAVTAAAATFICVMNFPGKLPSHPSFWLGKIQKEENFFFTILYFLPYCEAAF